MRTDDLPEPQRRDSPHSEPGREQLDDLLDALVAEYSDRVRVGAAVQRESFLHRVPPRARPGLERCLKMIDAGLAETPSASAPLRPGLVLGRYVLVRELGRGGMALVWLARDTELERPVALKVLRPGLALEARHADRFRREALAVAKLQHPHVVAVHGAGEAAGWSFIAMEYVEGPSLATVLEALPRDRPRRAEDLARAAGIPWLAAPETTYEQAVGLLFAPLAEALAVAHSMGLVHRDVKPSNVLIHRDGRAVLADFGLAKGEGDPALSLTGEALGTPFYMSPEQAWVSGREVDHRTDVYSLGVTLFETLAGERPFDGDNFLAVLDAIRSTLPPSLRTVAPHASRDAASVVRRAMAREPEERYPDAHSLAEDLHALAEGRTTRARREEGGPLRRAWSGLRLHVSGEPVDYRSRATLLGWPLVHIRSGRRFAGQPRRHAKGWIAIGDTATGFLAMGQIARGVIAIGGISVGLLFSWGGIAVGGIAFGGIAVAVYAMGGLAVGLLAFGGIALGYAAIGSFAYGVYSMGGMTWGQHTVSDAGADPAAKQWFETYVPWFIRVLSGGVR